MPAFELLRQALVRWVLAAGRHARPVLLLALALAAAGGWYATGLTINTDTSAVLDPNLPFLVLDEEIDRVFPQGVDNLVVVVEGENPDSAADAAADLAEALRARPQVFGPVFYPQGDPFFRRHGLLYLDVEALATLSDRLAEAQPLLGTLWRDASLRGFADVLGRLVEEAAKPASDVELELAPVLERVATVAEAQARGERKSLSWSRLMSGEEAALVPERQIIVLQPPLDFASLAPGGRAIAGVRELAAEHGITPERGLRVRLTGSVALDHEELGSVRQGISVVGLVSLACVVALLVWGLRSRRAVAATVATLLVGLAWTAAFAMLAVGHLNLISVAFAVLFLGLSVDFGIHFCLRQREACSRGADTGAALATTAASVGDSILLSALCAAIGFLAFLPTAYRGMAELGLIAGAGMFIAAFANLTVLPALLGLLRPAYLRDRERRGPVFHSLVLAAVRRHARGITAGALVLGVMATLALPRARFDFDPLHLKDPGSESVRTLMDIAGAGGTGPYSIQALAASIEEARALAERLRRLALVDGVETIDSFVPDDQDEKLAIIADTALLMAGTFAAEREPPPDAGERAASMAALRTKLAGTAPRIGDEALRRAAARLEAALAALAGHDGAWEELERRLLGTLPPRLTQLAESLRHAAPVTLEDLPRDLQARYVAADGRARIVVHPREDLSRRAPLERFVEQVRAILPDAAGSPVVILEAGRAVVTAVTQAAAIAIGVIFVLLLIVLRRPTDVLLVFAPLVLAALLTVAVTVVFGLAFNFANVIVLPLLFGLGVAAGIHLVLRERKEAAGARVLETSTPRAVVFSALTTIGSFGSLSLSPHPGTASMGVLLTIAIGIVMACTLLVLPAMMALARDGR